MKYYRIDGDLNDVINIAKAIIEQETDSKLIDTIHDIHERWKIGVISNNEKYHQIVWAAINYHGGITSNQHMDGEGVIFHEESQGSTNHKNKSVKILKTAIVDAICDDNLKKIDLYEILGFIQKIKETRIDEHNHLK